MQAFPWHCNFADHSDDKFQCAECGHSRLPSENHPRCEEPWQSQPKHAPECSSTRHQWIIEYIALSFLNDKCACEAGLKIALANPGVSVISPVCPLGVPQQHDWIAIKCSTSNHYHCMSPAVIDGPPHVGTKDHFAADALPSLRDNEGIGNEHGDHYRHILINILTYGAHSSNANS